MKDIETIWKEYQDALLLFIKKKTQNSASAEDILHEVFLKFYTKFETISDSSKVRGWLYQTARNTIIDHYRAQKFSTELPDNIEDLSVPDENTAQMQLADCLPVILKHLPDKYRQPISLAHIEQLTQQEIAQIESISLSGAKSRVQRGRHLLKEMLTDCCKIELDNQNRIIGYVPKSNSCNYC